MKNCVIFFDCRGKEIMKYLIYNKNFKKNFNIKFIGLNEYVVKNKFVNNTTLDSKHIMALNNADILILQVIETDRGFLNNSEVIKFCRSDCKVIKIPHYRNSIYEYKCIENKINKYDLLGRSRNGENSWNLPKKIKNLNNIDETTKIIQNEIDIMNNFKYDEDEMVKSMNYKINEFKKIDSLSDIKMIDYFNNNFKKHRLFQGR